MSEWISVEDRLPEQQLIVLWANKNGAVFTGNRQGFEVYSDYLGKEDTNELTHWMPLPEPPKEQP